MGKTRVTSQDVLDTSITDADVATANKDGAAATASMRTLGTSSAQAAAGDHTHAVKKASHMIPFTPPLESAAAEVLMPRPGINVGESGEHGTYAAIRAKAICGTVGSGTNTILIEADDNPAFSSATVLFTIALGTAAEADDTTLDNAWAAGDIFVRARMSAVGATAPKDLTVEFYFSEEVY